MFSNNSVGRLMYVTLIGVMMVSVPFAPQLLGNGNPSAQTHEPANKTSVAGSSLEVVGPGESITILSTNMRTAKPTDLVISVTLECAILTKLKTVGDDESRAMGRASVWVEIDGNPVMINPDEAGEDDGKVVFCDRTYQRVTSMFDDEDATIEDYIRTRSANAFNWIHMNAGHGVHSIVVKATLETETAGNPDSQAEAIIGKRTLVVEPFMFAKDETLNSQ